MHEWSQNIKVVIFKSNIPKSTWSILVKQLLLVTDVDCTYQN